MKKLTVLIATLFAVIAFAQPVYAKPSTQKPVIKTASKEKLTPINLNTAGAKEIADALTGVGMKKAAAIVEYRKSHGKFKQIEELAKVKGIGVATLSKNAGRIVFN